MALLAPRSTVNVCLAYVVLLLLRVGGHAPAWAEGASLLCWYTSQVDDSEHAYGAYLPDSPAPSTGGYPAVFHGHGYGWGVSAAFSDWQKQWADAHGWVLINVNARGPNFYGGIGDVAVQEVVKDASARFNLDPDRLYFTGVSMGGTGAYRQAVMHPDIFAAAAPVDGWTDYRLWHKKWYARKDAQEAIEEFRRPLLESMSPLYWYDRLQWGALLCMISGRDDVVWPEEGLRMARALTNATDGGNYDVEVVLNYEAGHGGANDLRRIYEFFESRRRVANPPLFAISTVNLSYGSLYWGRIDQLRLLGLGARLRVISRGDQVEALTRNVEAFTLLLASSPLAEQKQVSLWVDGFPAYTGPPVTVSLRAVRTARGDLAGWTIQPQSPGGLHKRAGLEGPLAEALVGPFLVVYATSGPEAQVRRHREEAEAFCRQWNEFNVHAAAVIARPEEQITAAEMAQRSLVVFGTLDSSSLLRAAQAQQPFPVEVHEGEVIVRDRLRGDRHYRGSHFGAFLVYPNPLSGWQRHLAVCSGEWATRPDGTVRLGLGYDLEKLPWAYPDYVIFNTDQAQLPWVENVNNKPPVTCYEAAYFVEAGFFDHQWQVDPLLELERFDRQPPGGVRRIRVGQATIEEGQARVRVVDELGVPVPSARVTVDLGDRACTAATDTGGWARFDLNGAADFTVLNVMATGAVYDWRGDALEHSAWCGPGALALRPRQFVTPLQQGEAGEIQVEVGNLATSGRAVTVDLLAPGGRLQPRGQQVYLRPGQTAAVSFWWHPHDLPPGRYPLTAQVTAGEVTLAGSLVAQIGPSASPVRLMNLRAVRPLGRAQIVVTAQVVNAGPQTCRARVAGYLIGLGQPLPVKELALAPSLPVEVAWTTTLTAEQWKPGRYEARLYVVGSEGSTQTCEFSLP